MVHKPKRWLLLASKKKSSVAVYDEYNENMLPEILYDRQRLCMAMTSVPGETLAKWESRDCLLEQAFLCQYGKR